MIIKERIKLQGKTIKELKKDGVSEEKTMKETALKGYIENKENLKERQKRKTQNG